jgi:hypothetical protein
VDVLALLLGSLLLVVLVVDVLLTVFVPRGGPGAVTSSAYRLAWSLWRRAAGRVPARRRRRFLSLGGPALLPLTVLLWAGELVLGFALLYLPFSDRLVYPDGERPLDAFSGALYLSGYSATTLGVGDVHPDDALVRLLTTAQAGLGFALFSVSIAYLLSVYGALQRSKELALEVSQYLGLAEGADSVDALVQTVSEEHEDELAAWLSQVTSRLISATEAQEQYPLVQYFHVPEDRRALTLTLPVLLELLTVCRSLLDPVRFPRLAEGRSTGFSMRTLSWYLDRHADRVRSSRSAHAPGDPQRRARHDRARRRLAAAGMGLRSPDDSWERYRTLHAEWDGDDVVLRQHYGYR